MVWPYYNGMAVADDYAADDAAAGDKAVAKDHAADDATAAEKAVAEDDAADDAASSLARLPPRW